MSKCKCEGSGDFWKYGHVCDRVGADSEIAGHQITKLLGVKDWFEWNGRRFDLKIVCEIVCEPMPEVSEFEKDSNVGCTVAAGLIGRSVSESWMNSILDRHDEIFEVRLGG